MELSYSVFFFVPFMNQVTGNGSAYHNDHYIFHQFGLAIYFYLDISFRLMTVACRLISFAVR